MRTQLSNTNSLNLSENKLGGIQERFKEYSKMGNNTSQSYQVKGKCAVCRKNSDVMVQIFPSYLCLACMIKQLSNLDKSLSEQTFKKVKPVKSWYHKNRRRKRGRFH